MPDTPYHAAIVTYHIPDGATWGEYCLSVQSSAMLTTRDLRSLEVAAALRCLAVGLPCASDATCCPPCRAGTSAQPR